MMRKLQEEEKTPSTIEDRIRFSILKEQYETETDPLKKLEIKLMMMNVAGELQQQLIDELKVRVIALENKEKERDKIVQA